MANDLTDMENEFTQVDISTFYDSASNDFEDRDEGIIVLTPKEEAYYNELIPLLKKVSPERIKILEERLLRLKQLGAVLAKFPSLLERHELTGGERTPQLLIDSLIKHQDNGDSTLRLPSKAILGKGYIVAKTHTFSSMSKIAASIDAPEKLTQALQLETITLMFALMAEDVYINLISDQNQPMEYRRQWAMSLLLLWEHRNDQTIESVAPVLQSVWTARRRLAPAFGTMMGTSEMVLITMQMDEQWVLFIKNRMQEPCVTQAMEEFLFGISHEQILQLRSILRTKGIPSISRDEVSAFLGEHVKVDAGLDYRDFYSLYTVRRDNARARERLKISGPHKTLEDYFIQFVTEQNMEKQSNDTFAKY